MTEHTPQTELTTSSDCLPTEISALRAGKALPDAYRLVRYRTEEGTNFKLQGYFTWTQGWSQRGGEWKDIETLDADDLSDGKPYGPLL